ncbi:MAG: 2-oxoacid:acceptor oxidoreductase subunit alpha [Propionibacteriaceae bacterium]|jgi:2-oxoglutarate ferredoxin oxidoreductase subunit alpha|nr:2-oxoacid:acceptor oxidoreductase subunit alpha [Propionibacteriaceae bacterium]
MKHITLDHVVIRFAGDSGDGMQLAGNRFTQEVAQAGNDFSVLPNYPAEIRAPQGTVAGVSSFQIHFADTETLTPGARPDVLVAMNPAALKANLADLRWRGTILADADEFTPRALKKVDYETNPLEDGSLEDYQVFSLNLTKRAQEAAEPFGLGRKDAARTKNFYALGILSWLYDRPTEPTRTFIEHKFDGPIRDANLASFNAGYNFGETTEIFPSRYSVPRAKTKKGTYRQISGNRATAFGLMAAAAKAGMQLFLGAYPITPASDVLHFLSAAKSQGVLTFQAEDEIAAAGAALGASFGGALGATVSSGPGVDLKTETIGLGVMLELPLVVVDVQRGGPSTGLPTKTEQSDLLSAIFGRHGEAPVPVLAALTPSDCFATALEAARIAVKYRTPVIMLTDSYLANGSEPWLIPNLADIEPIDPKFATAPNGPNGEFLPYKRDENLARAWALPGTEGLQHRVGGLEKADGTGNVNYTPANHDQMTRTRQAKIERIALDYKPLKVDDPSGKAKVLVLGWGSTDGTIKSEADSIRAQGYDIATFTLKHLNPLPNDLGDLLKRYEKIIVPELNLGQLAFLIRGKYLIDVESFTQVSGVPLKQGELAKRLIELCEEVGK